MNDISIPTGSAPSDPAVGSFDAVVAAVDAFCESEGIVTEGWVLAIEPAPSRSVWLDQIQPHSVRVFGSDLTDPHAAGLLIYAADQVRATGVEG